MRSKDHKPSHAKLAAMCRSLGLPARVAIVESIAQNKDCVIEDIVDVGFIAPATIAAHLLNLKKEGIIKGSVKRSKMCYCIDWDKLDEFKILFDQMYENVKKHQSEVLSKRKNCD